jgi:hypothetical protein
MTPIVLPPTGPIALVPGTDVRRYGITPLLGNESDVHRYHLSLNTVTLHPLLKLQCFITSLNAVLMLIEPSPWIA